MFKGTVFDNVRYGLVGTQWESAPVDEQQRLIEEACKKANAHDFVSELPDVRYQYSRMMHLLMSV